MNKKVALIKIWHGGFSPANPPMGLLFVGNSLKKNGYEPRIFHFTKTEALSEIDSVVSLDPLFIGFSIITGDPSKTIHDFCIAIKKRLPHVPIVFGGVHPSLEPEQCLKEDYVDYVILNEGEKSAQLLADALSTGKTVEYIDGIGFKKEGTVRINEFKQFHDLDQVSMDWNLIDIEKYIIPYCYNTNRVLSGYVASRGCPHNCGFCYNINFNRRKWRVPSASKVVQEVSRLAQKHNLGGIVFYDDNFTVNKKWALDVLQGLKDNGVKGIHIETRVDYINKDFLAELSKFDIERVFLGIESGSDRILKLISKGFMVNDTIRALDLLKEYSIPAKLSFILGIPTETLLEYRSTLELIVKCVEDYRVNFTMGFYLPYPGTPLFDLCVKRGFKKPQRFKDWEILDRWGGNDFLTIPWTNGKFLTSHEMTILFLLLQKILSLRDSKYFKDVILYNSAKFRFLNSGKMFVKILDAFFYSVKPILRFGIAFKKITQQLFYFVLKMQLMHLKKTGDPEYNDYLDIQLRKSRSQYLIDRKSCDERKKYLTSLLSSKVNLSDIQKALIIGCRNSKELNFLEEEGIKNCIGIDLFSTDKRIRVMDMHNIEFNDDCFGLVYCSHALEHSYDYRTVIKEIIRVVENNGIIVIEVPVNYPTKGADLHDFKDSWYLLSAFSEVCDVEEIFKEELKNGEKNNFEFNNIVRVIFKVNKKKLSTAKINSKTGVGNF